MKTYNIPWMSEEETERFLAEIREMALKPKAATAPSVQNNDDQSFSSSTQEPKDSHLTIGGL